MAAEVTVVVEVIQDPPEVTLHRRGLTGVHQCAQAPEQQVRAPVEVMAAVPRVQPDRAQGGRAARYDKNRLR